MSWTLWVVATYVVGVALAFMDEYDAWMSNEDGYRDEVEKELGAPELEVLSERAKIGLWVVIIFITALFWPILMPKRWAETIWDYTVEAWHFLRGKDRDPDQ